MPNFMPRTIALHRAPATRSGTPALPGLVLILAGLLGGCASFGSHTPPQSGNPACVTPQAGVFVTAAQRYPGRSAAMGFIDKLLSSSGKDGDLIITDGSVRFMACGPNGPEGEIFAIPHEDIELVYRDGNWLFLRSGPQEGGYRQYQGFALHGMPQVRGETLSQAGLKELRQRRAKKGLFVAPEARPEARLVIVEQGDPETRIASVDRSKMGKEAGKGVAGGAAAGVLVGLNPAAPIIFYPPAAVVLIVGGAVVGGTTSSVAAEKEAQRNALMLPLEDAIIGKALHDMAIGPTLAREIESLMRIESRWQSRTVEKGGLNCGDGYRDCALRGILGVVEVLPAELEFRADKSDLLNDQDQAGQTLSIFQKVRLYSTLSGSVVESIDLIARSDRHSLVEWRERDGARLRASIREAIQPMPDAIAMQLQRSLDKLITFE